MQRRTQFLTVVTKAILILSPVALAFRPASAQTAQVRCIDLAKRPSVTDTEIRMLVSNYLPLLNEKDSGQRLAGVTKYFTTDAAFIDGEGVFVGPAEVNNKITRLQAKYQGWIFKQYGEVEVSGALTRVPWQFGPASDPTKILGEDVIVVREGKVASLTVFLISKH